MSFETRPETKEDRERQHELAREIAEDTRKFMRIIMDLDEPFARGELEGDGIVKAAIAVRNLAMAELCKARGIGEDVRDEVAKEMGWEFSVD